MIQFCHDIAPIIGYFCTINLALNFKIPIINSAFCFNIFLITDIDFPKFLSLGHFLYLKPKKSLWFDVQKSSSKDPHAIWVDYTASAETKRILCDTKDFADNRHIFWYAISTNKLKEALNIKNLEISGSLEFSLLR